MKLTRDDFKLIIGLSLSHLTVFSCSVYFTGLIPELYNVYVIYIPIIGSLTYYLAYFLENNRERAKLIFTDKNKEILELYAEGYTMDEIMEKLHISKKLISKEVRGCVKKAIS